jgi:regulator of sigma E protease
MAIISVNLMVINLFPLPVLDGGHLLFLAYEKIARKPLPDKIQGIALRVGLTLIVMLAVFATFNDVKRFGWISSLTTSLSGHAQVATPSGNQP